MSALDISELSETQQEALQTYTSVTDQDPIAAIPVLQRAEWNVQIAIARFFDGEPTTDLLADARAAQSVPPPSIRQTSNLQYDALLDDDYHVRRSPSQESREGAVRHVDTTSNVVPAYRPPTALSFLFSPFNILFRILRAVLSPLVGLAPNFFYRIFRTFSLTGSSPTRRQLPPADTAQRFIREFEETYNPNPPLPWVESGFNLTLDKCKKDGQFMLVVLISTSHDDTQAWIRDTLMSSEFYQFLQTHRQEIVLWGGNVQDAEGYQVSTTLKCTKFPFMALLCQSNEISGGGGVRQGDMTVVMRSTGTTQVSELVAKLESTLAAQRPQLTAARAQRSEQQAQRSLREEQDSAYERSLAQDRERARRRREEQEAQARAEREEAETYLRNVFRAQQRTKWISWRRSIAPQEPQSGDAVRLSIRLPDGQRIIRKFEPHDSLEDLYAFVECASHKEETIFERGPTPTGPPQDYTHEYNFQLVSPVPRVVFDLASGGTIIGRIGKGGNLIVEELDATDQPTE